MKRTNKIISLVVTLAIILSSMIFVVPTAAEEVVIPAWTAEEASASLEGAGTADEPYLIGSVADFIYFVNNVAADSVYKLTADIDLSEKDWTMHKDIPATTEINGDGHTITVDFKTSRTAAFALFQNMNGYLHDVNIDGTWSMGTMAKQVNRMGVLACATYGGTFENINVNLDVDVLFNDGSSAQIGLICSYATWGNNLPAKFTNVDVTGNVKIQTTEQDKAPKDGAAITFGIYTGRLNAAIFEDCDANVDFTFNRLFGTSTVTRCAVFAGCVDSDVESSIEFNNCTNTSKITCEQNVNNGRDGSWIGEIAFTHWSSPIAFNNCVDMSEWSNVKGVKQAIIGYNRYYNDAKLSADTFFIMSGAWIRELQSKDGATAGVTQNMMNGVPAYYQDNGDTIDVYLGLAEWITLVDGLLPVYAAVAYGENESMEPEINEDLNVAIFTFDKVEEEGALPSLVYYNTDEEVVATKEITDSNINWTTFKAAEFDNGPYISGQDIEIATASQLALLAYMANTGTNFAGSNIYIMNDIDLAGFEWVQIWESHSGGFAGKIDGQGFAIKNMTLTADSYAYGAGFIGRTADGFEIKNVSFVDPVLAAGEIKSGSSIKAVATVVTAFYGGLIDGVTVTGLDLNVATGRMGYTGGIVGYLGHQNATIKNSSASGRIYGVAVSDTYIGGLVSRPRYGFIDNCVSKVDIDVELGFNWAPSKNEVKDENGTVLGTGVKYNHITVTVGGITGEVNAYVAELTRITNCTNNGNINVKITDNSSYAWVGGIVGAATTPGILVIEDCQNNGSITIDDANMEIVTPELGEFDAFNNESYNVIGAVIGSNKCSTIINDTTSIVDAEVVGKELNATMIDGLEVLAGARVRIDTTKGLLNSGLRFDAKVNKAVYEGIHGKKDSTQHKDATNHTTAAITLGMMIVPVEMVGEKTAAELYADENILKVDLTKGFYNVDSEGNGYFSAAIINLKEDNYKREFVAITYMSIQSAWVSSSCVVFGDINLDNARSAADVAGMALADPRDPYTAEQKAVLQQYLA